MRPCLGFCDPERLPPSDSREVPRPATSSRTGLSEREWTATPFRFGPFGPPLGASGFREGFPRGLPRPCRPSTSCSTMRPADTSASTDPWVSSSLSRQPALPKEVGPASRTRAEVPRRARCCDVTSPRGQRPRIRCHQLARTGTGSATADPRAGRDPIWSPPREGRALLRIRYVPPRAASTTRFIGTVFPRPTPHIRAERRRLFYSASTLR